MFSRHTKNIIWNPVKYFVINVVNRIFLISQNDLILTQEQPTLNWLEAVH